METGSRPLGRDGLSLVWAGGGLVLFLAGVLSCFWLKGGLADRVAAGALFALFGILAVAALLRARLDPKAFAACLLPLGLAVLLRVMCMDWATGDFNDFLAPWTAYFRENGGFLAIREPLGNYNAPYLYFLALFSYFPISELYLIKLLSIFFDLLLAWSGLRLARKLCPDRDGPAAAAFSILLLLPTVTLNGALWGQCDGVYAALVLLALADTLDGHPIRGVVWLGCAFSFKLQAIFLIPLWCILWYARRVKFKHLLVFPLAYAVTILPALLLGKPLGDILGVYFGQMGQYNDHLTLNAPSVYALIPYGTQVDVALWAKAGILAAFLLVAVLLIWLLPFRKRLTDRQLVTAGLILALGIPLLLPHMHERYFYLAEVLSVVWAVGSWRRAPVPIVIQAATLGGYHAYLLLRFLYPMAWGAGMLIAVLAALLLYLGVSLRKPTRLDKFQSLEP